MWFHFPHLLSLGGLFFSLSSHPPSHLSWFPLLPSLPPHIVYFSMLLFAIPRGPTPSRAESGMEPPEFLWNFKRPCLFQFTFLSNAHWVWMLMCANSLTSVTPGSSLSSPSLGSFPHRMRRLDWAVLGTLGALCAQALWGPGEHARRWDDPCFPSGEFVPPDSG